MRTVRAWALVDRRGRMAVIGGELPIYWRRRVAAYQWMQSITHQGMKIVRVEIRELPPKRKKARS